MKAYVIQTLVIDFDNSGIEEISYFLSEARYINPSVISYKELDIGEWTDEHPLNKYENREQYIEEKLKEI